MATTGEIQELYDRLAKLREVMVDRRAADLIQNPQLAEALVQRIDTLIEAALKEQDKELPPSDGGLAELAGVGPDAADRLVEARLPQRVEAYDDTVTSERILAVGDLYYIYQHERVGVFRAVLKLQELFRAGSVRLSQGDGAFGLYQFDRRQVLRYTRQDRLQAYRRVFGYTKASPPPGGQTNYYFHQQVVNFMNHVAQFYRDKRISEVIRPRASDPSFGSIAVVRRAGLDLRNNLKHASYGHVSVLRVEVMQLLEEAFDILNSPDIRRLFGADNAWDVIETVLQRYLNQPEINASARSRMAITGREVLRWLAQPHVLNSTRAKFEGLLLEIAEDAEEWLTSAQSLGHTRPGAKVRLPANGRPAPVRVREHDWEHTLMADRG